MHTSLNLYAEHEFNASTFTARIVAELGPAMVTGLQGKVSTSAYLDDHHVLATVKHFVGNESEYERMTISSEIPERALRELYLLPFEHVVATVDPWCVMGAYNRVDGDYACAHDRLLNQVLKQEWGFPGLVIAALGVLAATRIVSVAGPPTPNEATAAAEAIEPLHSL